MDGERGQAGRGRRGGGRRGISPLPRRPTALVGRVIAQVRRELGVVPEAITLHHPLPELLAAAWASLRETVVVPGRLSRRAKEAMAVAISRANDCPYCIDAHGLMLHGEGAGAAERALSAGEPPGDPGLAALTAWAASTCLPAPEGPPPVASEAVPEAVATVCCFQYINRMATILLGDSPLPSLLRPHRRAAMGLVGKLVRLRSRPAGEPGAALELVPQEASRQAERQQHLGWARDHPVLHATFAAFAETVEVAVVGVLSERTREALRREIEEKGSTPLPLGEAWPDPALQQLAESERTAARLALLAARAPHRVTAPDLGAFRREHAGEDQLLAVLAWGAHEAARAICGRLEVPGTFSPVPDTPSP